MQMSRTLLHVYVSFSRYGMDTPVACLPVTCSHMSGAQQGNGSQMCTFQIFGGSAQNRLLPDIVPRDAPGTTTVGSTQLEILSHMAEGD